MAPEDVTKNVRFIQEIEKHQCIYNFMLPEYTKKYATDAAWKSVAEEMMDTVHNCKERWRNIRTVFVRKMKPLPPEASGKKTSSKPYYLTDAMKFLLPFVRVNHNTTVADRHNNNQPFISHDATPEVKEDIFVEQETEDGAHRDYGDDDEISENSSPARESNGLEFPSFISADIFANDITANTDHGIIKHPNKKKRGSNVDYSTHLEVKKARMNNSHSSDGGGGGGDGDGGDGSDGGDGDTRKLFLLSLMSDVRSMTDAQMRKFRKMVLNTIDIVLDETPNGMPHEHF